MLGINVMTALQLLQYGNPASPDRWIGQTAGELGGGRIHRKTGKHFGHKTISVVRRELAAEQVRRWAAIVC
jgi:trans-2-enoyl-CoA reductase